MMKPNDPYCLFLNGIHQIETYMLREHCNTASAIIHRCVSPNEQPYVQAYIRFVCNIANVGGNEPLSNHDPRLKSVVAALAILAYGTGIITHFDSLNRAFDDFIPRSALSQNEEHSPFAFGNKIAKADTAKLNQQATCASALPKNRQIFGNPNKPN